MNGLARQIREVWEVPRDLLLGRYPAFVTGGPLPRGHVPVFVFHSLEPASFERKLSFLAENDYRTLSADEYFQVLMGAHPAPERAVVLTFDDGRGSVRSVGLPLLARYGMKAVVFLVPGRIVSRPGPLPPTWDDVRAGRTPARTVLDRESGDDALLSWEEVADLVRTGLFDFQSHTLTHGRVHIAPRLAGFLHPGLTRSHAPLDVPLIRHDGRDLFARDVPLGTPLLRSAPRTGEGLRFYEDPRPGRACVELVAEAGGEEFFSTPGWLKRLKRALGPGHLAGRFETAAEQRSAIRAELAESKRLIESHTGRPVIHLCYPWHEAGATARELARETGYRTAFCGKVPGVPISLPGGDPHAVARVSEDFIDRLPGRGRASLRAILKRKWLRRLRGGS